MMERTVEKKNKKRTVRAIHILVSIDLSITTLRTSFFGLGLLMSWSQPAGKMINNCQSFFQVFEKTQKTLPNTK